MPKSRFSTQYSGWPELLERYRAALDLLRSWDVRVPPGCRWLEYEDRIADLAAELAERALPMSTVRKADQAMYDFREMDELVEIVGSFPRGPGEAAKKRLQIVVGGTPHPDDEGHSPARDTQYEMYLRGVLMRGGIPAGFGNPDLLPRIDGEQVPIEAKRPKSLDNIDGCLRKGVKQVERSGKTGLVAISLDIAVRPDHSYLKARSHRAVEDGADTILRSAIQSRLPDIARRVKERDLAALIFTMRLPARVEPGYQSWLASRFHLETLATSRKEREIAQTIYRALEKGGS